MLVVVEQLVVAEGGGELAEVVGGAEHPFHRERYFSRLPKRHPQQLPERR
jgi:hypothetical protein